MFGKVLTEHDMSVPYHSLQIDSVCLYHSIIIVYDLRAQNLRFVAPMPEQIGTPTMHLLEVSGGTYKKFSSPKLGELGQIDVFQYRM